MYHCLIVLMLIFQCYQGIQTYLPVVLIPGIVDSPGHLNIVCAHIKEFHPDQKCILIQPWKGLTSTFPMWTLVNQYKEAIKPYFDEHPNGLHIIAHSQGAIIARTIIETTPDHPVKTFVALGGPNMGYYNCDSIFTLLLGLRIAELAYGIFGNVFSAAAFYKDPHDITKYLASNKFFPIINNEIKHNESEDIWITTMKI